MALITLSDQAKGPIKPMHGVGQPPFLGLNFKHFHYLTEAGIPFVRLHDVGSYCGGHFVDIPNIFPDFDADPADPASYDFTFTDKMLLALHDAGLETFYRLGVTIENYAYIKPYRIHPPKDNRQWARICEGIIRHYNEGWADGYHLGLRYWEIWNEPENLRDPKRNQMWTGTAQQYFELYEAASKHLKTCFPNIKVGGYASCGFYALYADKNHELFTDFEYYMEFFDDFLAYVKAHDCPLDFFSWHNYNTVKEILLCADYARKRLDEEGFTKTETTCNEWNCYPDKRGTALHAANTAAILLGMQDSPLDSAMFYDARLGPSMYGGMFNPLTYKPLLGYYPFLAFNELYKRGTEMTLTKDNDAIYAVAAEQNGDGFMMIANIGSDAALTLNLAGKTVTACKLIDDDHEYVDAPLPKLLKQNTVACVWYK